MTRLNVALVSVFLTLTINVSAQETDDNVSEVTQEAATTPAVTSRSSIQLKTTSVTGSRELPKVLVIVPWKTSEALGPGERPLASLVEEALTPVDPDVFRRQLDYYTELKDAAAKSSSDETAN